MPLLYRIEFRGASAIVRIEEQGSRRILYLDTLKSLAKEEDREALAFLTKIHLRSPNASRSSDTTSFQQIELNGEQSLEGLKLLAKTGRAYFNNALLQWDPSVAKIYWKGEKHSEKACTLSALLQWKGNEIPLEQCERVFPAWCLYKGTVFSMSAATAWKWIEPFLRGALFLEGAQKKKFLEEEPPVLWKESAPERPLEVWPQLILSDRTGCFANLWMDYPGAGRAAFEDLAPAVGGKARLRKAEEGWEKDLLDSGYLRKIVGNSRYYCPGDKTRETILFLLELGWQVFDARGKPVLRQTKIEWELKEENGEVAVRGRVHFQEREISLRTAMQARGSLMIDLDANNVGLLDRKGFASFDGEWEGEALVMKKGALGTLVPLLENGYAQWEQNLRRMAEGLKEGASLEQAPPEKGFRGELLPYQQKGVDWLTFLQRWGFSGLLADEMGLGKTVQVLAFFSRRRTNLPVLVVAPSSLLYHWRSEIERFLPNEKVRLYAGGERAKNVFQFEGIVVTSYAILRLDEELLTSVEFEAIVLDESNAIKTAASQAAKAACRLKGRFKIALTGTPMENRPEELWSQFRFLMPELLGERGDFQAAGLEAVRRKTRPFILRRKKRDVEIELPEKIESIAWVEMGEAQAQVYESYRSALRGGLLKKIEREGIQTHRMEILEAILRLRQICSDPRLVGSEVPGTKLELLIQDIEGKKALIYSQFTSMLQLIGQALREEGREFLYLDGSVPPEKRAELVSRFQEDENVSLFLLSLKAGGVGLNLTAADYVLIFDPWWNEAVENQAIDRAHRIGQKKAVIAKRYLAPNTIEEKMLRLKEEKRHMAEQLLEGEAFSWTEGDLLHLLS